MDYPVIPTDIQKLNELLRENYGIDTESTMPMYRISWAADQYEMRVDDVTPSGVKLLFPEMMNFPKYSWIKSEWILENLVLVPVSQQAEIGDVKKSYECLWRFRDRYKKPVQPEWWACQFVIDLVTAAKTGNPMNVRKYFDPDLGTTPQETIDKNRMRIDKLVEELFGDESSLLGRTVTGEAVAGFHPTKDAPTIIKEN